MTATSHATANCCDVYRHDPENWARVFYWQEFADDIPQARAYSVEYQLKGAPVSEILFTDSDTATNKAQAYALFRNLEDQLIAL